METIIPMIVTTANGKSARALFYGSDRTLLVIDGGDKEGNALWLDRWFTAAHDGEREHIATGAKTPE